MNPQQQWHESDDQPLPLPCEPVRRPSSQAYAAWHADRSPQAIISAPLHARIPLLCPQQQQQQQQPQIHLRQQASAISCQLDRSEDLVCDIYTHHPSEPTPPDSGRSKPQNHAHKYQVDDSSADEDPSGRYETGLSRALTEEWSSDEDSFADTMVTALVTSQSPPQALQIQPNGNRLFAGPSSYHERRPSSLPTTHSSPSSPVSPARTFAKPTHAGVVFDQRPIRDTPNNPFLEEHRRRYTRADVKYDEKRHSRGEEAARAHRKGFLTYVFRGQRILHPDIGSDDDSDDGHHASSELPHLQGPGTRLQPRLLFPEAHAQERRRARMRGAGSLPQASSTASTLRSQKIAFPARGADVQSHNRASIPSGSGFMSVPLALQVERRGNLFAAEISRRQAEQTQQQQEKKRKRMQSDLEDDEAAYHHEEARHRNQCRSEFLQRKVKPAILADEDTTITTTRWLVRKAEAPLISFPPRSRLHERLVAQLDKAGWSSGSGSENEQGEEEQKHGSACSKIRAPYEAQKFLRATRHDGLATYFEEPTRVEQEGVEDLPSKDEAVEIGYEDACKATQGRDGQTSRLHGRPGMLQSLSDNPFDLTVF